MDIVTILWNVCAAVAMTLAVMCGLVWLAERRDRANLLLCILGVATAGSAYGELGMMHSATTAEYLGWLRWYFVPVSVALVSQLLFVHYYLGTGRRWLLWTVIVARAGMVVVDFAVQPSFNFSDVVSLRQVSLFGEQVSAIATAVPSARQGFAVAAFVLWGAYLVDAAAQSWLKGRRELRRRAVTVVLGIIVPMLITNIYAQLLVFRILDTPVSNVPWLLAALVMMAFGLGRDFILGSRARLELAELRNRLAHVDRVSVLGQLASALAHELSQPLFATAANVRAALIHLESEKPDIEELREIFHDIEKDDRRAGEIIDRMRQLFKRHAIEMKPVGMEDIVRDVVLLLAPEAASKHVALHVHTEPGLPRVFGDRVHLTQVLLNLVMNSIHAVQCRSPGARDIFIDARAGESGEVEMAVRDSGSGVADGIAEQIFQPFFTTKSAGMGMGLSLSSTIVEAHGGRLWLEPTEGGATFRFTLRPVPSAGYSAEKGHHPTGTRENPVQQAPA